MINVGIDPSVLSTAVTIYDGKDWYFYSYYRDFKPKNLWCSALNGIVEIEKTDLRKHKNFSENEIFKLEDYERITSEIEELIRDFCSKSDSYTNSEDLSISIEGYSQSSRAGHIHDLVAFGTLLRSKMRLLTNDITILPPKTMKKMACEYVYEKDKKGVARNYEGKSGGSFNKWDMYQMFYDQKLDTSLFKFSTEYHEKIISLKSVPKPLEDVIDSFFLAFLNKKKK